MKKIVILPLLLALATVLPAKERPFFAAVGVAAFQSADSGFKNLYGATQVSPEHKLGYHLYRNFYFWLGGGFISATGVIPVVEDEAKASQTFLSLGAGWETRRWGRLQREVGTLKKEMVARGVPLPTGSRLPDAKPSDQPNEFVLKLPSDAELDRAMTFFEKMWRRLIDMVQTMQREQDKKS